MSQVSAPGLVGTVSKRTSRHKISLTRPKRRNKVKDSRGTITYSTKCLRFKAIQSWGYVTQKGELPTHLSVDIIHRGLFYHYQSLASRVSACWFHEQWPQMQVDIISKFGKDRIHIWLSYSYIKSVSICLRILKI